MQGVVLQRAQHRASSGCNAASCAPQPPARRAVQRPDCKPIEKRCLTNHTSPAAQPLQLGMMACSCKAGVLLPPSHAPASRNRGPPYSGGRGEPCPAQSPQSSAPERAWASREGFLSKEKRGWRRGRGGTGKRGGERNEKRETHIKSDRGRTTPGRWLRAPNVPGARMR